MSARTEIRRAPLVLVTGGKGGVGKTTVAANLGVELARNGHRVLLADLDVGLANLHMLLGVTIDATLDDVLNDGADPHACVVEGPGGVHLLPARGGDERMGELSADRLERLAGAIEDVGEGYDVVVADSAAGIGPDVLRFASDADRVLVVTTPEVAALTDAYGLIKALDQFGTRAGSDVPTPEVVVNRANDVAEGQAIARKLRSICERFLARSPRHAGWLPRSMAVEHSAQRQAPFALGRRRGLEQLCLTQIAKRVERVIAPAHVLRPHPPGAEPGRDRGLVRGKIF